MADFDLGTYGAEVVIDDSKFTKGMDNAEKQLKNTEKRTRGFGKAIGGIATGAMAGVGIAAAGAVAAVAGVGVALGAAGVAGTKMASTLQESLNKLQMSTGATDKEMKGMEESLKNIYNAGYGQSFGDIADSMALVRQNTGLAGQELEKATQNALMLRDTFGYEVSESTRAATSLMKQFGISSSEAMSMLAEGTQKGLNRSGDLIDSIEEYSVYFQKAGIDAQGMFAIFENASKAGVRNLDFVGDAMKEFGIIMKEDSDKARTALESLNLPAEKLITQFAQGGEGAKKSFQTIVTELGKIEDPLKRNQIGVQLFGTKFEDLEAKAVLAMGNVNGTIDGSKKTLEQIGQIKYDSLGEAIKGIGRNFKTGLLLPLGELVLPILQKFANWIHEKMPVLQKIFGTVFNKISLVTGKMYNFFATNILPILQKFWTKVSTLFPVIQEIFQSVFNAILTVGRTLWNFFKANILPILMELFNWVMSHMPTIRSTMEAVFNNVTSVARKLWNFFRNNILPILAQLYQKVQEYMPQIQNIVEKVFGIVADVIEIAWDIIENSLIPTIGWLWNNVNKPWMPKIGNMVDDAFSTIIDVVEGAVSVFEDVTGAIQTAIDWLGSWNDTNPDPKTVTVHEQRRTSLSPKRMPSYDVGTPFVPHDQVAMVHKGEAIIPI